MNSYCVSYFTIVIVVAIADLATAKCGDWMECHVTKTCEEVEQKKYIDVTFTKDHGVMIEINNMTKQLLEDNEIYNYITMISMHVEYGQKIYQTVSEECCEKEMNLKGETICNTILLSDHQYFLILLKNDSFSNITQLRLPIHVPKEMYFDSQNPQRVQPDRAISWCAYENTTKDDCSECLIWDENSYVATVQARCKGGKNMSMIAGNCSFQVDETLMNLSEQDVRVHQLKELTLNVSDKKVTSADGKMSTYCNASKRESNGFTCVYASIGIDDGSVEWSSQPWCFQVEEEDALEGFVPVWMYITIFVLMCFILGILRLHCKQKKQFAELTNKETTV